MPTTITRGVLGLTLLAGALIKPAAMAARAARM